MVTKKQNSGFTLLELLVTISIIGILAASVTYGVADYVKEKRSEQHVVALWSELSTLRARAIKDDRDYFVQFTNTAGNNPLQYTIYVDNDQNGLDINTDPTVRSGFLGTSGKITAGIATGNVLAHPSYDHANGLFQGSWLTGTTNNAGTATANTIVFRSDEIGTISEGALFLVNTSLNNRGYAIMKADNTHTLKLWKWNGSQWYEM